MQQMCLPEKKAWCARNKWGKECKTFLGDYDWAQRRCQASSRAIMSTPCVTGHVRCVHRLQVCVLLF